MDISNCIGTEYIDSNRKRHVAESLLFEDVAGGVFKSKDGKLIRLITDPSLIRQCSRTIDRLIRKPQAFLPADTYILPDASIVNAGSNMYGYCFTNPKDATLREFTDCPGGERLYKWYFNLTGGISYRLKLGYLLGRRLSELHSEQVLLNNISPDTIFVNMYEQGSSRPEIAFSGLEFISSYSNPAVFKGQPLYCDPLVSDGQRIVSTYSDTFSFAILLFQLLTTWHPFVGDLSKCENAIMDLQLEKYIGDPNNADDEFEDLQLLIPNELQLIFERIFVDGLHNTALRPSLTEITDACLAALNHISKCSNPLCGKEYDGTLYNGCPFCNRIDKCVKVISYKYVSSDKKILMPHGSIKEESALPRVDIKGSTLILSPGLNYLSKSFFVPNIGYKNEGKCISIAYDDTQKTVTISNRFKRLKIVVNSKVLAPYKVGSRQTGLTLAIGKEPITILLPFNTNLIDETSDEIDSKQYGEIKTQWVLKIVQGEEI